MISGPVQEIVLPSVGVVGTAATPAIALAIFGKAAWAIPVVGAALAGVMIAITVILNRKGPKQKVITTQIVDELEQQLDANLQAYLASPRERAHQTVALANFDAAWAWLNSQEACGAPELGEPGRRCLADRKRSGRWPWEVYYRDPIANDPMGTEASAGETISNWFGGSSAAGDGSAAGGVSSGALMAGVALIGVGLLL